MPAFYAAVVHDSGMEPAAPIHRSPRRPHAWAWALVLSQGVVALAWWQLGWRIGLPLLLASHLVFVWGTLRPRSALFGPVLSRLPTSEKAAWLTIDDGPSADTAAILDLLDVHAAKATFFVVADRAATRPGLLREILRRGHELGNHSASHPSATFWMLGPRRMAREIEGAQAALRDLAGVEPRWFRAVVGMANPFVAASLARLGLARVAWSARGYDAVTADPAKVVARIEADLAPGAIILMHEGAAHGRSAEAVQALLERMAVLGYRCVLPPG